jgi:hypothetical protein
MRAVNIDGEKVLNVIIVEDLSFPVSAGYLIEDTSSEANGYAQAGGKYIGGKFFAPVPSNETQEAARKLAYTTEADPIYFMWQAGEATQAEWVAKREEIKASYPYYEEAA